MTYCISDIHGEYDRYLAMLGLIQFSEDDILYVLGDCIDRHPHGVEVLQEEMERLNRQETAYEAHLQELASEEPSEETLQRRQQLEKSLRRVKTDRERLKRVLA